MPSHDIAVPAITRDPAPDRAAFVERLQECERRAGGQSALARKTTLSQSTIRGYTARQTEPPRDILLLIAQAAAVSVHWLTTGKGPIEPQPEEPPPDPVTCELDEGTREIATAISKKYSVPLEYVVSRLQGSEEFKALEKSMRDWSRSRPIPIIGRNINRIWGVLFQEDLEVAAPGALLKDIKVYRVKMGKLPAPFLIGDWAIVDCSKPIADGLYCVLQHSGYSVQIRKFTVSPWMIHVSMSMDDERLDREYPFQSEAYLKSTFDIVGRLVGAIRFVAAARDVKSQP